MMKKEINKNTPNPKQSMRRQQRGNTLVPILFGLGIAAATTMSFLNQGEGLIDDNNRVLAVNEISSILKDYNAIRSAGVTVGRVTDVTVPGLTAANVYGKNNEWNKDAITTDPAGGIFSYTTDSVQTCQTLIIAFKGFDRVTPSPTTDSVNSTNCSDGAGKIPNTTTASANVVLNLLLN